MRCSASVAVRPRPKRLLRLHGSSFEIHTQKLKSPVDSRGRKKGESSPEKERGASTPLSCRYRQVGENASAVLLLCTIGLSLKEKVEGGQRETEGERERTGEREWEVPDSDQQRGGGWGWGRGIRLFSCHIQCSAT